MFISYCFKNLVPSVNNVINVKKKPQSQGAIFKDATNVSLSRFSMSLYLIVLNLLFLDLVDYISS